MSTNKDNKCNTNAPTIHPTEKFVLVSFVLLVISVASFLLLMLIVFPSIAIWEYYGLDALLVYFASISAGVALMVVLWG